MFKMLKKITAVVVTIVLVAVGGSAIAVRLSDGHFLSVQSGSMVPALHKGDMLVVTRTPASELKIGDVVTFINPKNQKETITHRLIGVPSTLGQGLFQTKGDANQAADPIINNVSIIGKVQGSAPKVGFVADFLRTPLGLGLIIYLPALIIIGSELRRLAEYYRKIKPYRLPGFSHKPDNAGIDSALKAIKVMPMLAIIPFALTINAHAALSSSATLTPNTIRTATVEEPEDLPSLIISKVNLRCSLDNTASASRRPRITIYNPTDKELNMMGWQIKDNSGTIITMPNTRIRSLNRFVIRLYLPGGGQNGLQYAGDRIQMFDDKGVEVDSMSWGSDTTELNPSIQNVDAGTRMRRKPRTVDTNSATDWKLVDNDCPNEGRVLGQNTSNPRHDDDDQEEAEEDAHDDECDPREIGRFDIRERGDH